MIFRPTIVRVRMTPTKTVWYFYEMFNGSYVEDFRKVFIIFLKVELQNVGKWLNLIVLVDDNKGYKSAVFTLWLRGVTTFFFSKSVSWDVLHTHKVQYKRIEVNKRTYICNMCIYLQYVGYMNKTNQKNSVKKYF